MSRGSVSGDQSATVTVPIANNGFTSPPKQGGQVFYWKGDMTGPMWHSIPPSGVVTKADCAADTSNQDMAGGEPPGEAGCVVQLGCLDVIQLP